MTQIADVEFVVAVDSIESDIERLKEITGLGDISVLKMDWAKWMRNGVIVNIMMGRWRAQKKLTLEDLGIRPDNEEEEKALKEAFALGHKMLAPDEWIKQGNALEQRARSALQDYSFRINLSPGKTSSDTSDDRFVTADQYAELKAKLSEIQAEYMQLPQYFSDHYEEILKQLSNRYSAIAETTYRTLLGTGHDPGPLDVYVDRFVGSVLSAVPTPEEVAARFYFEVEASYIPLPSLVADDMAKARAIELEVLEAEEEMEAARIIRQARVRAEETESQTKLRLQEEMHRDVIDRAKKQKDRIVDRFLTDIKGQLADKLYQSASNILSSLERNSKLMPRSVVEIDGLIQSIQNMNFFGDPDVDSMIERLQSISSTKASQRSMTEVQQIITDVATVTKATLICLDKPTRRIKKEENDVDVFVPADAVSVEASLRRLRAAEPVAPIEITPTHRRMRSTR